MSSWTEKNIDTLKNLWNTGKTAREIAEIMGPGFTRNSVIGKSHRLKLTSKIKARNFSTNQTSEKSKNDIGITSGKTKRNKFKSLIIEKDFEPENPKQLEELDESSCKWPIGHPDEKSFYFCGRSSLKDFSYCKLHLLYAYQPKGKKDEVNEKEEVPEFIEKKIQSA